MRESYLFKEFGESASSIKPLSQKPAKKNSRPFVSSVWSFEGSGGEHVYRWYGTLPRQLLERLFDLYVNKESVVFDPFMGLGTSIDVAADRAIKSFGTDVNPLAVLAAKVKLSGFSHSDEVFENAKKILKALKNKKTLLPVSARLVSNSVHYNYTRKWFRQDTFTSLIHLLLEICKIKNTQIADILFVSAAKVIKDTASIDLRCTHHLVTKSKDFVEPGPLWFKQINNVLQAIREKPPKNKGFKLIQASCFDRQNEKINADFVIIHPPYLGVIHYHLIHRLVTDLFDITKKVAKPSSFKELDFNYDKIKNNDISTDETKKYNINISQFVHGIINHAKRSARFVVIIGDQRNNGFLRHPFTEFISAFENQGIFLEENFIWYLQNNSGMHVLRKGNYIDHNYILVFRRP